MKRKKTKYRIRNDGEPGRHNFRWLEYKGWFFWYKIPTPRGDNPWDWGDWEPNAFSHVSQYDCEWFAEKWPYIEDYFKQEYYPKQKEIDGKITRNGRLEVEAKAKKSQRVSYL